MGNQSVAWIKIIIDSCSSPMPSLILFLNEDYMVDLPNPMKAVMHVLLGFFSRSKTISCLPGLNYWRWNLQERWLYYCKCAGWWDIGRFHKRTGKYDRGPIDHANLICPFCSSQIESCFVSVCFIYILCESFFVNLGAFSTFSSNAPKRKAFLTSHKIEFPRWK